MAKWQDEGFSSPYAYRNAQAIERGYPGGYPEERAARARGDFAAGDFTGREYRERTNPTDRFVTPGGRELWRVTDAFDHDQFLGSLGSPVGFGTSGPVEVGGSGNSWHDEQGARLTGYTAVTDSAGQIHVHYTVHSGATGSDYEGDLTYDPEDFIELGWADIEGDAQDDQADYYGRTGG